MNRRDIIKGITVLPWAAGPIPVNSKAANIFSPAGEVSLKALRETSENIFKSIGVETLINCRGTFTIIGGSLERPVVRAAMEAASVNFVQYDELAEGIGRRLAELTKAEWGMVSAGCAAGLKHITAGCVTGGNPEKLVRIPDLTGFDKTQVVIPKSSRNAYDHAIRNIGVEIITVDTLEELCNALTSNTAMIYLSSSSPEPFTLEEVAKCARMKNVPILVDAAAEDLTIPNVHLQRGADVVAYSGGKAMCGPQCAGLLIGRKDLLMSAWQASSPHHGPGRDNKVGREEMMGMLAAVESWVTLDHKAKWNKWLSYLDTIKKAVEKLEGIKTEVVEPADLSDRSPMLNIIWDAEILNITGEEISEELGRSNPRIALASGGVEGYEHGPTFINITTGQMQPGDDKVVARRVYEALSRKRPAKSSAMKTPVKNISGRWDLDIQFFSSRSRHTINIEQEGNWIRGTHKGDFTVRDVVGTIDGDTIKLKSSEQLIADMVTFIFSGNISGETISGTIYMGEYLTANFSGSRYVYENKRSPVFVPGGPPLAT